MPDTSKHEQIIVEIIERRPGIKGTELVFLAVTKFHRSGLSLHVDLVKILDWLSEKKRILEVEYVLRDSEYRVRSIYFPVGTEITLR